jgi:hypothetical protein
MKREEKHYKYTNIKRFIHVYEQNTHVEHIRQYARGGGTKKKK